MVALTQNALREFTYPASRGKLAPAPAHRRVAVVMNRRARKVDAETMTWVRSVVPNEDLFLSNEIDDLESICEMVIARRYDAVLWGGGDGTFVRGMNTLMRVADRHFVRMPDMGVLRLGTGNAVAETLGAADATADGLALDLSRARAHARRRELSLLEVDGEPSVFAGFGLDAQILDDFGKTVGALKKLGLANALQSANLRYFLAVTGRSIPRFVLSSRTEIVAINRGEPAVKIDVEGRAVGKPIPAGRVIWRGLASLASAATVPFYGLALKMFPHAQQRPDRFQLRLTDIGSVELLSNLREAWRGRYQGERVHDFLCDKVELRLAKPAPFQSGGDLVGERSQVTIGMSSRRVAVV